MKARRRNILMMFFHLTTLYILYISNIYIIYIYIHIPTLHAFFKISYIKIKQKDIHKVSVIFRLFTNLLQTHYIFIDTYIYI